MRDTSCLVMEGPVLMLMSASLLLAHKHATTSKELISVAALMATGFPVTI